MRIDNLNIEEFTLYLRYKPKKPCKQASIDKYIGIWKTNIPYWKEHDYSVMGLMRFFDHERKRNIENATLKNYKKLYGHIDRFLKIEPVASEVSAGAMKEKDFEVFEVYQIERIINSWLPGKDNQLYCCIHMAFSELGCRPSALCPCTWDKYDYNARTLRIYNPKTDEWVTKLISYALNERINALPRTQARIFPRSVQKFREDLKARCQALGYSTNVSLKTYRKTVGTQSVEDDIHWRDIMDKLDHTDPRSLRPYIKKSKKGQKRFFRRSSITKTRVNKEEQIAYMLSKERELEDERLLMGITEDELNKYRRSQIPIGA